MPLPVGPVTRKMPCGSGVIVLHAGEHVSVETQPAEIVEIAGGAIEQTHHDALAIQRGQRGNAQIHFAAQRLDLDAAVLRQAALGDIELGHQLDARDHGGLQFARRRFLIVEHAIDAIADAELFFERLHVDIAGALLDRLRDHGVDQPDDRRLAGHVAQVFEIFGSLRRIGIEIAVSLRGRSP